MATSVDPAALTVHVVPMKRRHLSSVVAIERQVYPTPWSAGLFASELALHTTRAYFVAKVGRAICGYAGLMLSLDDGHVTTIAVDPSWQRRSIGTRLLLALAEEGLAHGAANLTLKVRVGNGGAQDLYRRFGFKPVGVRKNYYAETSEDTLVMWAHDVDTPEYRELLEDLRRGVPGETLVERPRRW